MKRYFLVALLLGAGSSLFFFGCKNGNLFGGFHSKGSGDPVSLMSDARAALVNREFNNAKAYYESVLAQQPNNSQALYGAAVASMGTAGLDLGTLISNVISSQGGVSGSIARQIEAATIAGSPAPIDPGSILNGLNLVGLKSQINRVVCYLQKIRSGGGDGVIPADDISVCVSLTLASALRAVIRTTDAGIIDLRKSTDGQRLVVEITDPGNVMSYCSESATSGNATVMKNTMNDLAMGLEALIAAIDKLNPATDSTLRDIKTDIQSAYDNYKSKVLALSGITADCSNLINSPRYVLPLSRPRNPGDCLTQGTCCQY